MSLDLDLDLDLPLDFNSNDDKNGFLEKECSRYLPKVDFFLNDK